MICLLLIKVLFFQVDPLEGQAARILEESEMGGQVMGQLFAKGPDAALLVELGDQFVNISKPIQSKSVFSAAKALDANNEAAEKGLKKSVDRVAWLENRIKTFTAEIEKEHDPITYNRRAAILFHMGRYQEALDSLDIGLEKNPGSRDVLGLKRTFEQGLRIEHIARGILDQKFSEALSEKAPEKALTEFGKIVFTSLGRVSATNYLERLSKTYPDLEMKKIKDVLAMFQSEKQSQG